MKKYKKHAGDLTAVVPRQSLSELTPDVIKHASHIGIQIHSIVDNHGHTNPDAAYYYLRSSWPPGLYTKENLYDPSRPCINGLLIFKASEYKLLQKCLAHDESLARGFGPLAEEVPFDELPGSLQDYATRGAKYYRASPYPHHDD